MTEAGELDRIYTQYSGVRRMANNIAKMSQADIYRNWPRLAPIADLLGEQETPEGVMQVLKEALRVHEIVFTEPGSFPSMSWTRLHFGQQIRQAIGDITPTGVDDIGVHPLTRAASLLNPANQLQRFAQLPVAYDEALHAYTLDEVDPFARDAPRVAYQMGRLTESERVAASVAQRVADAPDIESKLRIFRNLQMNLAFATPYLRGYMGDTLADAPRVKEFLTSIPDVKYREALGKQFDDAFGGGMFGKEAWYGVGRNGDNLSLVRDDSGYQYGAAIWNNQTGKVKIIDLASLRRAQARLIGAKDVLGSLDDFAYDNITQLWKGAVLQTPSYALHIAMAEDVPNALREGVFTLARSTIIGHMAKLGWRIEEEGRAAEAVAQATEDLRNAPLGTEEFARLERRYASLADEAEKAHVNALGGLAWNIVTHGMTKLPTVMTEALETRLRYAMVGLDATGGVGLAPGVASAANYEAEIDKEAEATNLFRRQVFDSKMKPSDTFGMIDDGNAEFMPAWQGNLNEVGNDPSGQLAARELIAAALSRGRRDHSRD